MSYGVLPANYWRRSQQWSQWLGRRGEVIEVTTVWVAVPSLSSQTPYQLAIVDFDGLHQTWPVVASSDPLQSGDQVEVVWRRYGSTDPSEILNYGLKVRKVVKESKRAN